MAGYRLDDTSSGKAFFDVFFFRFFNRFTQVVGQVLYFMGKNIDHKVRAAVTALRAVYSVADFLVQPVGQFVQLLTVTVADVLEEIVVFLLFFRSYSRNYLKVCLVRLVTHIVPLWREGTLYIRDASSIFDWCLAVSEVFPKL